MARSIRAIDAVRLEQSTARSPSGLVLGHSSDDGFAIDFAYDAAGRPIEAGPYWTLDEQEAAGGVLRERCGNWVLQVYERKSLGMPTDIRVERSDVAGDEVVEGAKVRRGLKQIAESRSGVGKNKARFIADDAGNVVDTHATPPGRYIQPDRSATDILQEASHPGLDPFTARTHTHPATVTRNPLDPSKGPHATRGPSTRHDGRGPERHERNSDAKPPKGAIGPKRR
jgi:YD repeat-containing protein